MSLVARKPDADTVTLPRYLLEDSPGLEKKVREFEALEARAKNAIEHIGAADDILNIREQAKAERDLIDKESLANKQECARLLSEARNTTLQLLEDAQVEADRLTDEANRIVTKAAQELADSQERMAATQQVEQALDTREREVSVKESYLNGRASQLDETETQLLQEKSKLATVREQIDSILE